MKTLQSCLKPIRNLARECGQFIKDADRSHLHIDQKCGRANFVTEYDRKVQERLRAGLLELIPDARFIGEEGSAQEFSPTGKFFIVDPIDGTTNFIKDYRASCISVGLVVDGTAELGVIYNPYSDEMFSAMRDGGAFCNGNRLHVSSEPLENALVIFGTSPYREDLTDRSFNLACAYFKKAVDVRRSGSAALDMCSIAAGRAELFFELSLSPWDYAAGALIVKEAGGLVSDIDGRELAYDRPCSVVARNAVVQTIPLGA
ncbi:MAG: inositol monophosphatase [Kiritimatiellae bacterium]|nr:inositol monophosphatase [Kiritimatiellia bacterium]